jgi:hypothetical protein
VAECSVVDYREEVTGRVYPERRRDDKRIDDVRAMDVFSSIVEFEEGLLCSIVSRSKENVDRKLCRS